MTPAPSAAIRVVDSGGAHTPENRGMIHHLDLTVRDPWTSATFYERVLGHMGYRRARDYEDGIDFDKTSDVIGFTSVGLVRARDAVAHNRFRPGLHHVAWTAESREDVDALHTLLLNIGAKILDEPADYPEYGKGYYALFFADPDGLKLEYVYQPVGGS